MKLEIISKNGFRPFCFYCGINAVMLDRSRCCNVTCNKSTLKHHLPDCIFKQTATVKADVTCSYCSWMVYITVCNVFIEQSTFLRNDFFMYKMYCIVNDFLKLVTNFYFFVVLIPELGECFNLFKSYYDIINIVGDTVRG